MREEFYPRLVWVVNGLRRKRYRPSFQKVLRLARVIRRKPLTFLVPSIYCALLREWADGRVDVFFDFGSPVEDIIRSGVPVLWRLDPQSPKIGVESRSERGGTKGETSVEAVTLKKNKIEQ